MNYNARDGPKFRPYPVGDMAGRPPSRKPPPFGAKLAALRKERGFTQAELAGRLDVSAKMVDYYERRARNPSTEIATKVAAVFGVSVAFVLGEGAPPSSKKTKPGPPSRLEERLEKVRKLPRRQQEFVIRMLDTIIEQAASR